MFDLSHSNQIAIHLLDFDSKNLVQPIIWIKQV